jgi:uncharacterized protein YggE
MRHVVNAAVISVSLALLAGVSAGSEGEKRLVTATATGKVQVDPDEAVMKLGIDSWDSDPLVAKRKNDDHLKKVQTLAKGFKVDKKDVEVSRITIEPTYRRGVPDFTGCYIKRTVVIRLKDVSKFEDVLLHSLKAGANKVFSIKFRTTKLKDLEEQARAKAIKAAKDKAGTMASELGKEVGTPHSIREDESKCYTSQGDGESALDKIVVRSKVTVSFELK